VARPIYSVPSAAVATKTNNGGSVLTVGGSHEVVQQLNVSRNSLNGVNRRPLPAGKVTVEPNGRLAIAAVGGREFNVRPNGTVASVKEHGTVEAFRPNGRVQTLRTPTLAIMHDPHGGRTIVVHRPDHSVVVSMGRRAGYIQRPVMHNGVAYVERSYVRGSVTHTAVFTSYSYHGVPLVHYVPQYTYAPAFYGWAYYPWDRPAAYAWGWAGDPWVGYYGGYYSPTQAYLSGAAWLADYYLSQTLAGSYQQDAPADGDGSGDPGAADPQYAADDQVLYSDGSSGPGDDAYAQTDTPITPDVKQGIADEVQQQLAYENAAAAQPGQAATLTDLPQVLQPNHLFVVSYAMNVTTADQQGCGLEGGNVLKLVAAPDTDSPAANLTVVSSRRGDCPAGAQVTISLDDLQEMQNNFRAQLDAGLHTMHDQQGQGGLPGAPNSAIGPPPVPGPDLPADGENVAAVLQAQQRQALATEAQVTQTAFAAQAQ
jgi:hypothetical protein